MSWSILINVMILGGSAKYTWSNEHFVIMEIGLRYLAINAACQLLFDRIWSPQTAAAL